MCPNNPAKIMGVRNYETWPKHIYKMLKSRMFVYATHKSWKCAHNFFINLASGNLQNASELYSEQLRLWTHQSWKFVQNFLCKPWRRRTSEMRLNINANSLIFERTNRDTAPWTFFINLAKRELQYAPEFHSKQLHFLTQKLWNCAKFFRKTRRQRTFEMHLNFTANSFILGRKNCGIAPTTCSLKPAGRELPECVWISRQTASFFDAQILELCPEHFLKNSQAEKLQNASELHSKQLHCWTHKSGIAPTTFSVKLVGRELPECVWIPRPTASFLGT